MNLLSESKKPIYWLSVYNVLKVIDPSAAGAPTDNYKEAQFHDLSTEKFEKTKFMYNQFIPP